MPGHRPRHLRRGEPADTSMDYIGRHRPEVIKAREEAAANVRAVLSAYEEQPMEERQ
jgi:hypothetical protein